MNFSHGVIPLLKPPGMTSHDAVAHVRRVLKIKRVGHTGTLDPAAAGVLPICVGQATRLVEGLQNGTKEYLAEATFGFETDTLDATGQTVRECEASALNYDQLEIACADFRGFIEQEPPLHSAIKIGGQKLYEIARAGGEVEIPRRPVTISALEITRFEQGMRPRAFLRIECSGGTYIRSLVRDIGRAVGSAATMTFLSRTRNGVFHLADAVTPAEFEQSPDLLPLFDVLETLYGCAQFDDQASLLFWQGRTVKRELENFSGDLVFCSNHERTLLTLATHQSRGVWKAEKVFDLRENAGKSKSA